MYQSAFKLPLIRIRNVRVVYPISAKTLTLRTGAAIPISNAIRWRAVFSEPPDIYTATRILHTELRLVWKEDIVPFLYPIFVVLHIRVTVSLYVALSREVQEMVTELTGHAASNVDAPYERKLDMLLTCRIPD